MPKRAERAVNCAIILGKGPNGVAGDWGWRAAVLNGSLGLEGRKEELYMARRPLLQDLSYTAAMRRPLLGVPGAMGPTADDISLSGTKHGTKVVSRNEGAVLLSGA